MKKQERLDELEREIRQIKARIATLELRQPRPPLPVVYPPQTTRPVTMPPYFSASISG